MNLNKLYMARESDVMYELIKIEGNKCYVQNDEVDGKFTVKPDLDPLTVMNDEYYYIGEVE